MGPCTLLTLRGWLYKEQTSVGKQKLFGKENTVCTMGSVPTFLSCVILLCIHSLIACCLLYSRISQLLITVSALVMATVMSVYNGVGHALG